ncbi:hypothetical protein [Methylopila sp. M107]|uniref:hypothetical protein n=1 Tax=Methylopila sp. M107 TaxID=1101190 RepID=UPI0012DFD899|nr:hypothetical protein [Methylopila sp. M107]
MRRDSNETASGEAGTVQTDMVREGVTLDSGFDRDQRNATRLAIADWIERNRARIRIIETRGVQIALADDREARDNLRALRADIDLMGTRTFLTWMAEDYGVKQAATAWGAIMIATDCDADPGEDEDPVYIRRAGK